MSFTPDAAMSCGLVMFLGLSLGNTTTSLFLMNTRLAFASICPDLTTLFIWVVLAEAKTSASAPWPSCVASCCEPAKLKTTFTPGLALSKVLPISPNAPVSEEAAKTLSVTFLVVVPPPLLVELEPQAARRGSASRRAPRMSARGVRRMRSTSFHKRPNDQTTAQNNERLPAPSGEGLFAGVEPAQDGLALREAKLKDQALKGSLGIARVKLGMQLRDPARAGLPLHAEQVAHGTGARLGGEVELGQKL